MTLDLFVFDWSGTISDDRRPVYETNMRLLRLFGKPTVLFEEWLPSTPPTVVGFLALYGIDCDVQDASALYSKYYNAVMKEGIAPILYPDVHDVLTHLKGQQKDLAVLSCHPPDNLLREADKYGIKNFFSFFHAGSQDKASDLAALCRRFGTRPESVLYTGDTTHDIRAAKQAGVVSAAVCRGYHTREQLEGEKPDIPVMEDLAGLKQLF
jgi:phosphoglycolate phosphatase-like HAD superfamily hydrolase